MTIPQTGLPTLCYIHPSVLRGMASTHTPSRKILTPKVGKKEKMLEDIRMRTADVRHRVELMNVDDEELEKMGRK